jgi:hypothetical protein
MTFLVLALALVAGWFTSPVWLAWATGSAATSLGWQAQVLAGPLGEPATTAMVALATSLGVPFLLAAVAEASRGGRSARSAATIVLLGLGGWALAGPDGGAFAAACLVTAVVIAVLPGRVERMVVTAGAGFATGHWAALLVRGDGPVAGAAGDLARIVGGQVGWWTAALVAGSLMGLVAAVRLLARSGPVAVG